MEKQRGFNRRIATRLSVLDGEMMEIFYSLNKFNNRQDKLIEDAIAKIIVVCGKDDFLSQVYRIKEWDLTNDSGKQIIETVIKRPYSFELVGYRAWRWSKVRAYVTTKHPGKIFINTRILNKKALDSIAGTIFHEMAHIAGYHHKGNRSKGNQDTVPYKLGRMMKRYPHKV